MKFFITGVAGFIGFHLSRRLIADGHTVAGFDGATPHYDVGLKAARARLLSASPAFSMMTAMLEDHAALTAAVERAAPDVIVHLAAKAGVRASAAEGRSYIDANLAGTWNLLEAARLVQPRHTLIASSSAVYGANPAPFRETDRADEPLSLYAATKKGVEAMGHAFAHLHGVPTTMLRFFTVYGPWGRPDMALYKFAEAISAGNAIDVYGRGAPRRDLTYVDDVVEAIARLIAVAPDEANRVVPDRADDSLSRQAPFRVVNVGGGQPVSVEMLIQALEREFGQAARRNLLPAQPGDVPMTQADTRLLEALTRYRPQTPLADGVRAFAAWYRDWTRAQATKV